MCGGRRFPGEGDRRRSRSATGHPGQQPLTGTRLVEADQVHPHPGRQHVRRTAVTHPYWHQKPQITSGVLVEHRPPLHPGVLGFEVIGRPDRESPGRRDPFLHLVQKIHSRHEVPRLNKRGIARLLQLRSDPLRPLGIRTRVTDEEVRSHTRMPTQGWTKKTLRPPPSAGGRPYGRRRTDTRVTGLEASDRRSRAPSSRARRLRSSIASSLCPPTPRKPRARRPGSARRPSSTLIPSPRQSGVEDKFRQPRATSRDPGDGPSSDGWSPRATESAADTEQAGSPFLSCQIVDNPTQRGGGTGVPVVSTISTALNGRMSVSPPTRRSSAAGWRWRQ